jgi:hypothetical protein
LVVAHPDAGRRRRPQHLGPGQWVEGARGRQELLDPGASLTQVIPQLPEQPQDPEQVRKRPGHGEWLDLTNDRSQATGTQFGVALAVSFVHLGR